MVLKVGWIRKSRNVEAQMDLEPAVAQDRSLRRELSTLTEACNDIGLQHLPNDLTRMIFLASLRDCNSGIYLHPQLTQCLGIQAASALLRELHERIFSRLLETRLTDYVPQLQEYIHYSKTDSHTMLHNWQSLQAYRATVPLHVTTIWAEIFFLNIEAAIAVLQEDRLIPAS